MRRLWACFSLCLALVPYRGFAVGLSDADPKNFFSLLEEAALVVQARRGPVTPPQTGRAYYLYSLRDVVVLKGTQPPSAPGVVDEVLTAGDPQRIPPEGECLIFLAALPDFTAYRDLKARGYAFRLLGGNSGVLPVNAAVLGAAKEYLGAESGSRARVLTSYLNTGESRLANDAALTLAERGKLPLSAEEIDAYLAALRGSVLQDKAKAAAVRSLATCGSGPCVAALQSLAADPPSPVKWAALRALQGLGMASPVERLAAEFRGVDDRGKVELLGLILVQGGPPAADFAASVLAGPYSLEVKRAAVRIMTEHKTPAYEGLLLQQIGQGEEGLRVEAILALGRLNSAQAVPLVIPLLDNPSPALRGAAFFMLSGSDDPRAQEYMSRRFSRDHHGVWEQNQHFYDSTGPARPQ